MKNNRRQSLYALLAAIIWGAAFSAQSMCAQYLGPFTITALRSIIAFLVLLIVCLLRRRTEVGSRRDIIVGSLICGAALFAAANLQQLAINMGASAGKAGFVTALYIVLVPVGQIFFKHTLPSRHWIAVAVAVTGMYFLCITDGFSISSTDLILLMCAFLFTIQILSARAQLRTVPRCLCAVGACRAAVRGDKRIGGALVHLAAALYFRFLKLPWLHLPDPRPEGRQPRGRLSAAEP